MLHSIVIVLETLAAIVLVTLVLRFILHQPQRPKRLDAAEISSFVHGLILFGLDGAFLRVSDVRGSERIIVTKRTSDREPMFYCISVSSPKISEASARRILDAFKALSAEFDLRLDSSDADSLTFSLRGAGVSDQNAMEGAIRLILRCVDSDLDQRYRVALEGPNDPAATREYFGLK